MPLHRSLLFWFGLLILGFLVWAWADSRTSYASYRWYSGSYRSMYLVSSQGSQIVVNWARVPAGEDRKNDFRVVASGLGEGVSYNKTGGLLDAAPWISKPPFDHWVEKNQIVVGGRAGRIEVEGEWWRLAHWLLILCYLPLWLGLAMWRARRIAKARRAILGKPGAFFVRAVLR